MDFLKEIFRFFIAKEYSFTSKFIGVLLVITSLFFIDNILGFSFYYSNNQKITQLKNIETLKKDCSENKYLLTILNETEEDIINRKNILDIFFNLFSKEQFDKKNTNSFTKLDTVYILKYDTIFHFKDKNVFSWNLNKIDSIYKRTIHKSEFTKSNDLDSIQNNDSIFIETDNITNIHTNNESFKKSRSRIWHTLTSSYLLILLIIFLPFVPFTQKPFDWGMMIGMWISSFLIAGLVWFNQYLFGLIPVILNRPWINYVLNLLIHTSMLLFLAQKTDNKKKTQPNNVQK